jgi:hypothetical protein
MHRKPTVEQLAAMAAMLDSKLPPDKAVARAHATWEAAYEYLNPDEKQAEKEAKQLEENVSKEAKNLKWLPRGEEIPLSEAFSLQDHFKDPKRFETALKKEGLLLVESRCMNQEQVDECNAALARNASLIRAGQTKVEDVPEVEPVYVEGSYWTSRKATHELLKRIADRRRAKDRKRKHERKTHVKSEVLKICCGIENRKSGKARAEKQNVEVKSGKLPN